MLASLFPPPALPAPGEAAPDGPPSRPEGLALLRATPPLLDELEARLLLDAIEQGSDALLVCGDDRLDAYGLLARARMRGIEDAVADGVVLARAFTVHQFVALVEETLPLMAEGRRVGVALVTGVTEPFLDEDVTETEANVLLPRTLRSLATSAARGGFPIVATTARVQGRLAELAQQHAPRHVDVASLRTESRQRRLDAFLDRPWAAGGA